MALDAALVRGSWFTQSGFSSWTYRVTARTVASAGSSSARRTNRHEVPAGTEGVDRRDEEPSWRRRREDLAKLSSEERVDLIRMVSTSRGKRSRTNASQSRSDSLKITAAEAIPAASKFSRT